MRAPPQPLLVARAAKQRQEREAVARRPMAEVRALRERTASRVSSPPASRSASCSSSPGAIAARHATIPGAPWHHCRRIPPLAGGVSSSPAPGGQFARPSSSIAKRLNVSLARRCNSRWAAASAATQPANPCAGPRYCTSPPQSPVQSPVSSSQASRNASALSRQRSSRPIQRAASSVPGLPHMNSRWVSPAFAATSSAIRCSTSGEGRRRRRTSRMPVSPIQKLGACAHRPNSGSAR